MPRGSDEILDTARAPKSRKDLLRNHRRLANLVQQAAEVYKNTNWHFPTLLQW